MKLTTEKVLIFSGLGYIILATSYFLVYLANYNTIVVIRSIKYLRKINLLKVKNAELFDSSLTWGLASFWGIMFLASLALWNQHEKEKLKDFIKDETIGLGVLPFLIALGCHFGLGFESNFLLSMTGLCGLLTVTLYFQERE